MGGRRQTVALPQAVAFRKALSGDKHAQWLCLVKQLGIYAIEPTCAIFTP